MKILFLIIMDLEKLFFLAAFLLLVYHEFLKWWKFCSRNIVIFHTKPKCQNRYESYFGTIKGKFENTIKHSNNPTSESCGFISDPEDSFEHHINELIKTESKPYVNKIMESNDTSFQISLLYCHRCNENNGILTCMRKHIEGELHQKQLQAEVQMQSEEPKEKVVSKKLNQKETVSLKLDNPDSIENEQNSLVLQENKILPNVCLKKCFLKLIKCKTSGLLLNNVDNGRYFITCYINSFHDLKGTDIIEFKQNAESGITAKCLICEIETSLSELAEHVASNHHLKILELFSKIKIVNNSLHYYLKKNLTFYPKGIIFAELGSSLTNEFLTTYFCNLCNVELPNELAIFEHYNEEKHKQKILKSERNMNLQLDKTKIEDLSSFFYYCFICNENFNTTSLLLFHYDSDLHRRKISCFMEITKKDMKFRRLPEEKVGVLCTHCKFLKSSLIRALYHIKNNSCKVKKNANDNMLIDVSQNLVTVTFNDSQHESRNIPIKIDVCVKQNEITNSSTVETDAASFDVSTPTSNEVLKIIEKKNSPISELKSLENEQKVKNSTNISQDNPQNMGPDFLSEMLKSIKILKPSKNKKKRKKTRIAIEDKKSLGQTLHHFGQTYARMCIEDGEENIYNIDFESRRILSLGFYLTFPWNSERVCIPCCQLFKDSYESLYAHLLNTDHLSNLREIETIAKEFENYPEQCSDLELALAFMNEESHEIVKCYACNSEITNEDTQLHIHINSKKHIQNVEKLKEKSQLIKRECENIFTDSWLLSQQYFCEICRQTFEFEIDFAEHLTTKEHSTKMVNIKVTTLFHLCPVCLVFWFGKFDSFDEHLDKDKYHKFLLKDRNFTTPRLPEGAIEFLNSIVPKVEDLVTRSNEVVNCPKEKMILQKIENQAKGLFPKSKAYLFGSRLFLTAFRDSDLDIYLDCENTYHKTVPHENCKNYLHRVAECFEGAEDEWFVEEKLYATRVPILILKHKPTGLKCDISFSSGLSVEKSKLLRYNF